MKITNDLTTGSVGKTLMKYAVPMILTSILQSTYSLIDMVIVGQFVGGTAVSGVNNGALTMNLLAQIAIGFTVGGNILIGQFFGAKEEENAKKSIGTLFVFSLLAGAIATIALYFIARNIMIMLGAPALEEATIYLKTCAFGIPFIFAYNALNASLRAIGNSKKPFHFIACATILNMILDIIFIVIFGWGVFGVALATLLSQCVSFLLALSYVYRNRQEMGLVKKYLKIDIEKLKLIMKYGFPIALQWTIASISWLGVAYLFNKYGVDVSAGNGISNKIKEFCQVFLSAMSSAGATMIAQNLGAKEYDRAESVMKVTMKLTVSIAIASIVMVQVFAPQLVNLFITEPDVAGYAITNLRIEIIAQVFYAMFYSYNILATGSGHTVFVMANSFLNCIIVRLILAIILESQIGLTGIYYACMIAPLSSVPVGYIFYKTGRWKTVCK